LKITTDIFKSSSIMYTSMQSTRNHHQFLVDSLLFAH